MLPLKYKVKIGMKSSGKYPITGTAEVDETVFGSQEKGVRGRNNLRKMVGVEKKKKGVSRLYARVIPRASAEHLGSFMKYHIDEDAQITTDKWTGYTPLKKNSPIWLRYPQVQREVIFIDAKCDNKSKGLASSNAPPHQ